MEPSTDTNARREARRRRILENSESRLHMIMSRHSPNETEDTIHETNARKETRSRRILENSESHLHKIIARHNLDEREAEDKSPVENHEIEKTSLEEYRRNKNIRNGTYKFGNSKDLHYAEFDEYERSRIRFNGYEHDEPDEKFLSNINDRNTYSWEKLFDGKFMLYTYLSYRVNLIMLAAIINILLLLKLDDWFGKAILIPYLPLMMGRLYNFQNLQKAKCSSLISVISTVILWKIKSSFIYKLQALLMLFNIIIYDLCLYIFNFVLMHYIINLFYYYYHIPANA
ncbi:uncharacterized protein LOC105182541 isoform X2 [Harpegnathos saltator]|uniref:uncharacterized protein LOC105182541 isoform X2 n=1 Tax=Harpegnathos saltator TaxID=610380 RepID=UPI000DBEE4D5|nr:uncharacterized protein LOC105182541 isoform X2 [Harpegnathos saltator]